MTTPTTAETENTTSEKRKTRIKKQLFSRRFSEIREQINQVSIDLKSALKNFRLELMLFL
jgi:hypothetical protein